MDQIREIFLIWKKRQRDEDRNRLFQEIWKAYHPRLQSYVSNFQKGNYECRDQVSEILVQAFESIDSYNCRYAFSTWIYTLARNYTIDRFRKKTVSLDRYARVEDHEPEDHRTPESIMINDSQQQMIRAVVSKLSDTDKELVFLHFYEEMTYCDIAVVTGIPEGTVKYRMSETRKALKKDLERSFIHET